MTSMRLKEISIILLITLLMIFIVAEIYLRCFSTISPVFMKNQIKRGTCLPDPLLGWINKNGVYIYPSRDMPITVTINNNGSRATAACDTQVVNHRDKIILIGCSWMFGQGLSDQQTMGWKIQEMLPEMSVLNYGVKGYSTYQALLMLERVLPVNENTALVIYGFLGHHIDRNTAPQYWRSMLNIGQKVSIPYVTLNQDHALIRHKPEAFSPWPVSNYLATFRSLEDFLHYSSFIKDYKHRADCYIIMQLLLLEMRNFCEDHGCTLIVALFDMPQELAFFYSQFCHANNIQVINFDYSALKDKPMVITGDTHPNEDVNALWADQTATFLRGLMAN